MAKPNLHHAENGWHRHSTRIMPLSLSEDTEIELCFGFGRGGRPDDRQTYFAGGVNWRGFNDETRITWFREVANAG